MIEVGLIYGTGKDKLEERIRVHLVIIWFDVVRLINTGCWKVQQNRGPVGNDCTQQKFQGRQVKALRLWFVSVLAVPSPNAVVCSCLLWGFALSFPQREAHCIFIALLPHLLNREIVGRFLLWLQATICKLLVTTAHCNLKIPGGILMELWFKPLNVGAAENLLGGSAVKAQVWAHRSVFLSSTTYTRAHKEQQRLESNFGSF